MVQSMWLQKVRHDLATEPNNIGFTLQMTSWSRIDKKIDSPAALVGDMHDR